MRKNGIAFEQYYFSNQYRLNKVLGIFLGCFCTYSNASSFEYIRDSLEKTLLSNLEQEDRLPFQGLPLVIVFAADKDVDEKEHKHLREEGQNLSGR